MSNNTAKLKNKEQTITTYWQEGAGWQITDIAPEKGARQRNKPSINQHSENPTPKQDSWWATELIPEREDNVQI
jgi:hypothetical protein